VTNPNQIHRISSHQVRIGKSKRRFPMARTAHRASGKPVTVGELMLRPDVHGRRRPEDLEVLELAYRMRRRVGPDPAVARTSRSRALAVVTGLWRRKSR
jgi:hypothetical protein